MRPLLSDMEPNFNSSENWLINSSIDDAIGIRVYDDGHVLFYLDYGFSLCRNLCITL